MKAGRLFFYIAVVVSFFIVMLLPYLSVYANDRDIMAVKSKNSETAVGKAIKMLEKIELQAGNKSIDRETKKEYIDMLELEIERTGFFINELKDKLKHFDQYFDMLESVKLKTVELKNKIENKFEAPAGASGRISQGTVKQITADQIYDLEAYFNYSESKKMLDEIEKELSQNKFTPADKKSLVLKLGEHLVQIDRMLDDTRFNKRNIEKNIIKMLEIKLRSKNLLDKFYKNF